MRRTEQVRESLARRGGNVESHSLPANRAEPTVMMRRNRGKDRRAPVATHGQHVDRGLHHKTQIKRLGSYGQPRK